MNSKICAVIFDMDGTMIDTEKIKESGWKYAGDMIENGKPNPEIYLKAVELLDIQKEKCIGIEDSNSGILSVYRAGLKPIMIPDLEQPKEEVKDIQFMSNIVVTIQS